MANDNRQILVQRLSAARAMAQQGQRSAAVDELKLLQIQWPASVEVAIALSRLLPAGSQQAQDALSRTMRERPADEVLAIELAGVRAAGGNRAAAIDGLHRFLSQQPASPFAWLVLGQHLEDAGRSPEALVAHFEALLHAQALGVWTSPATTPAHVAPAVGRAVQGLQACRETLFMDLLTPLEQQFGAAALVRMRRAVEIYLGREKLVPADPMQRPRYLYVPGLPDTPFLDPALQPWAPRLRGAFADIRQEALGLLVEGTELEDFVKVREGDRIENYLGGVKPSWEGFFFYRHGRRYDDNHRRCPKTSAVIESIDLARIPGQTPEILFSVLAGGTTILPHHGVTNARNVMHLPLIVPPDCALSLVNRGTHAWEEGELVSFDDTFLHEAWNRSDQPRVILLMDCWNPHLSGAERAAVIRISQAIGLVDIALRSSAWTEVQ